MEGRQKIVGEVDEFRGKARAAWVDIRHYYTKLSFAIGWTMLRWLGTGKKPMRNVGTDRYKRARDAEIKDTMEEATTETVVSRRAYFIRDATNKKANTWRVRITRHESWSLTEGVAVRERFWREE